MIRYNRSFEFDSVNDDFPDYVLDELIPRIERLGVRISHEAKDRMVMGGEHGRNWILDIGVASSR